MIVFQSITGCLTKFYLYFIDRFMNSSATAEWSLRITLGDTPQFLTHLKQVSDTEITYNMWGDFELPNDLHVTKEGFL